MKNYKEIPAAACTLSVGAFELGDNGEGAKSAPIKMVARSGKPIEHWYWGTVVHDLSGMTMHKARIPIDYVHDANQILGYLNHFDSKSGDLVASGALIPFKDSDRATEIIHKSKAGVPYEASINFGGDGIKLQLVTEGTVAEVNGYSFEGPGVIVREWPLRGVAVCPYGADMNTESAAAFSDNAMVFSASVVTEPEAATGDVTMSDVVDVEAQVETPEVELEQEQEQEVVESVEGEQAEDAPAGEPEDAEQSVEADENAEPEEMTAEATDENAAPETALSRDEFTRIADEFGSEIAVQTVRDGGDYSTALRAYADALKSERDELKERVAELSAQGSAGKPAPVAVKKEKASLFKTGR